MSHSVESTDEAPWYTQEMRTLLWAIVFDMWRKVPYIDPALEPEDFYQAACLRLCTAWQRYRPDHVLGATWETFAAYHARGAIADVVRGRRLSARTRQKRNTYAQHLMQELRRRACEADQGLDRQIALAEVMGMLTPREREVCTALFAGERMKSIGKRYGVTESCISYIIKKTRHKLIRKARESSYAV